MELNRERQWNYKILAEKVGSHEKTIGDLARGQAEMTWTWMVRLAGAYGIKPTEIVERQIAEGLRSVAVVGRLQAGNWTDGSFDEDVQRHVAVPNDPALSSLQLYARRVEGESMNKVYPHDSIVVLSRLTQRPGEIIAGKRYHVRRTRGDLSEDTLKTLVRDGRGEYWLQPESDSPEFAAFKLDGENGESVELLGRVRYALTPE